MNRQPDDPGEYHHDDPEGGMVVVVLVIVSALSVFVGAAITLLAMWAFG